ncbi:MAG: hypothetical protein JNL61_18065 [Rhizobiaceae bacterium]|nr:hypothetical protein [Rhizobiaceae bacterium]
MSILSTLGRIASEYNAARARYLTERAVRALPAELRKDIGWPDAHDNRANLGVGTWAGDK